MLKINSNVENVSVPDEKAYSVLVGFVEKNLGGVPGITGWETSENGCSFVVQGITRCTVTIADKTPFSKVAYRVETDKNISADVVFTLTRTDINETGLQGFISADVPFFLQGMVKGVIEKFMGTVMQYLKTAIENG